MEFEIKKKIKPDTSSSKVKQMIEQSKEKMTQLCKKLEESKTRFEEYINALNRVKANIKTLEIDVNLSDESNISNIVKSIETVSQTYNNKLAETTIKMAEIRNKITALTNEINALDAGKPSNEVDSRIDFAKQKLDAANKAYNTL